MTLLALENVWPDFLGGSLCFRGGQFNIESGLPVRLQVLIAFALGVICSGTSFLGEFQTHARTIKNIYFQNMHILPGFACSLMDKFVLRSS